MRIYIAGPMRGIPRYNFPAFDAACAQLKNKGHEVSNPADLDRQHGFDPAALPESTDWNKIPDGFDFSECVKRDLAAVQWCDAVYLLPGWEKSKGAMAEVALAEWLGKEVLNRTGEVRVTDPATGGQKGSKPERFDLLPVEPLEEIARVYGWGATKYADDNWRKGYSWRLSFAAMMRHAYAFWRGETRDQESGLHHLAHAAWHCLTLMWFTQYKPEKDDRFKA